MRTTIRRICVPVIGSLAVAGYLFAGSAAVASASTAAPAAAAPQSLYYHC